MPDYAFHRSIEIDAPTATVHGLIVDFTRWPDWSPWTIQEPECHITYFGDTGTKDSGYSWAGERIGSGEITLRESTHSAVSCDLQFLKPFKSQAKVRFDIEALTESRCQVTWHMQSSMPFFLFFMIANIKRFVGMDYERGLRMLKELAETGAVASNITSQGEHNLPSATYIGTEITASLSELPAVMPTHYEAMAQYLADQSITPDGPPFAQYLRSDFKADQHRIVLGVPVTGLTADPPAGYALGTRAAFSCVRFDHTGGYDHLGNVWATAIGWNRHHKRKADKRCVGIEVYVDDPANTPRETLLTELYIPVKN